MGKTFDVQDFWSRSPNHEPQHANHLGKPGTSCSGICSRWTAEPVVPSEKTWQVTKFVRHKTDETYLPQRDKTMQTALSKWKFVIFLDTFFSDVGKQLLVKTRERPGSSFS